MNMKTEIDPLAAFLTSQPIIWQSMSMTVSVVQWVRSVSSAPSLSLLSRRLRRHGSAADMSTMLDDMVVTFTDDDHETACVYRAIDDPCTRVAVWRVVNTSPCGCTFCYCETCRVALAEVLNCYPDAQMGCLNHKDSVGEFIRFERIR